MNGLSRNAVINEAGDTKGTGWVLPWPDLRDFTEDTAEIQGFAKVLNLGAPRAMPRIGDSVDLRDDCSPIEDQGNLGSCTAHAAAGIVEYFQNKRYGQFVDGSRLFVYKATRNLMGVTGDTGAWLRTTMGALVLCGIAPERYWSYTTNKVAGTEGERTFDDEPPAFVYALADNYEAIKYFCHDPVGGSADPETVLNSVKKYLAAGIPSMFGFFGFPSSSYPENPGEFPFPCPRERAIWGHAVVAIGYDDKKKITNTRCNQSTKGALLIRNSWGTGWGERGYGWLPYDHVRKKLALDFWSLLNMEWVNIDKFGLRS